MTITVTDLFRHPVKAYGVERLDQVTLLAGACLPGDRKWAVLDEAGSFDHDAPGWTSCRNFAHGAKSPELMAVTARTESDGRITLMHRDLPNVTVDLNLPADRARFLRWAAPLTAEGRAASVDVVRAGVGMTDSDYPSVSIMGRSSLRALSQAAGRDLAQARFRGNVWVDGTGPWEEFEWVGKRLSLGQAVLEGMEPITRCRATTANPETGQRDTDTLGLLNDRFGHQEFGLAARVIEGGLVAQGDTLAVL